MRHCRSALQGYVYSVDVAVPQSLSCDPRPDRFVSVCRRFGTKCAGCSQVISPTDLVRRARSKVFHLNCFTCIVCNKQLSTGEELYILEECKFLCKDDYLSNGTALKDTTRLSGAAAHQHQTPTRLKGHDTQDRT